METICKANQDDTANIDLINEAIKKIRLRWDNSRRGPYGKQLVLQEIYTVYKAWPRKEHDAIRTLLAKELSYRSPEKYSILRLIIEFALPHIEPQVVNTWVDAIRYGEARHVRTDKLRGFLYHEGGLVRCAELFREAQRANEAT